MNIAGYNIPIPALSPTNPVVVIFAVLVLAVLLDTINPNFVHEFMATFKAFLRWAVIIVIALVLWLAIVYPIAYQVTISIIQAIQNLLRH